jgi:accessory gene regulator B
MTDPIELTASKLAHLAKRWNPDITDDVEDIRYGVALRLNYYLIIAICLIIGLATHKVIETILSMSSFIILRRFSGGRHCPTLTMCLFVSVILLAGIPHIPPIGAAATYLLNALSLVFVVLFSERRQRENVMGAMIMFMANFIFNSEVISLAFIAQGLLLIKRR